MNSSPSRKLRWALVLAAGKGTRFKSERAKVLHPLGGKPMAAHLLDRLPDAGVGGAWIVVGYQAEEVKRQLAGAHRHFVLQEPQLGTGHAVMAAAEALAKLSGSLLVAYGDTPLIRTETLKRLFERREREGAAAALLTCEVEDPRGYGRIVRDASGRFLDIVEERDATPEQKQIHEMNPGLYCFQVEDLLGALGELTDDNRQGEYYLTDIPRILRRQGERVLAVRSDDPGELRGINDRRQLAEAEVALRQIINRRWMEQGVSMLDPGSVLIDSEVRLGPDTTLYPGVILEGATTVGRGCTLRAYCHLVNAHLDEEVTVDHGSVIRDSRVEGGTTVGPFAHLRGEAHVGPGCRVGNFVEIKKSRLGAGSKAAHLTYLGDATLGAEVNVGAGVITCNYDGREKHRTVIEDEVFVGSDCQLIAPVKIGKGAYLAAGSSITDDVPEGALAIARQRQTVKPDWVKKQTKSKTKGDD